MWVNTATPQPVTTVLDGTVETDVVVIGGGITGMSTAVHLAEAGLAVVVLEAKDIGWGASSRNGGHMGSAWTSALPDEAIERCGEERGERINTMWAESGALVANLIERHGIDCDYRRPGMVWGATNDKHLGTLEAMAEQWGRYGHRMDILTRQAVPDYIASDKYIGGAYSHENVMFNPASYVRGLARAAMEAGAVIHARSPATGIEKSGERWRVSCPAGAVVASKVMIGTNAYTGRLWPGLDRSFYTVRLLCCASEPYADHGRSFLLKGIPFHQLASVAMFSIFMDTEGRMLGGAFPTIGNSGDVDTVARPFDKWFTTTFPTVPRPHWSHLWHGSLCIMPDSLPRIYELAPGVFAAMGYSGTGNARATIIGREVAKLIATGDEQACPLAVSTMKTLPFTGLAKLFLRCVGYPLFRFAGR
jgi:glycine/D-amino acid oxidase-like deaminating enzyme